MQIIENIILSDKVKSLMEKYKGENFSRIHKELTKNEAYDLDDYISIDLLLYALRKNDLITEAIGIITNDTGTLQPCTYMGGQCLSKYKGDWAVYIEGDRYELSQISIHKQLYTALDDFYHRIIKSCLGSYRNKFSKIQIGLVSQYEFISDWKKDTGYAMCAISRPENPL